MSQKGNTVKLIFFLLIVFCGFRLNALSITYPFNFKFDGNPLVRIHGAADPDVHVWDDTVWAYCSQDRTFFPENPGYASMDGFHVFSTTDLKNWTDHGEILHSKDVSWGVTGYMWAPGAARKKDSSGQYVYYLYYPHQDKNNSWRIGLAIGSKPQGPFKDIGSPIAGITGIDPKILIDDDGTAYIYNNQAIVAKLKPNMRELAEVPKKIIYASPTIMADTLQKFCEGSYMHKKNGKYYYSYSNFKNKTLQGFYAIGDNPYGPFEWKGGFAPHPQGAQDHHSIIEFKGNWYYFYHIAINEIPVNKEGQGRITCFDRLYYNSDGTIKMVIQTRDKPVDTYSPVRISKPKLPFIFEEQNLSPKVGQNILGIEIHNMQGKKVASIGYPNRTQDFGTKELIPGIYSVHLISNSHKATIIKMALSNVSEVFKYLNM